MHEYLNPAQAGHVAGMATSTLANRRALGLPPAYLKLPNGLIRYRYADLVAWIESGSVAA